MKSRLYQAFQNNQKLQKKTPEISQNSLNSPLIEKPVKDINQLQQFDDEFDQFMQQNNFQRNSTNKNKNRQKFDPINMKPITQQKKNQIQFSEIQNSELTQIDAIESLQQQNFIDQQNNQNHRKIENPKKNRDIDNQNSRSNSENSYQSNESDFQAQIEFDENLSDDSDFHKHVNWNESDIYAPISIKEFNNNNSNQQIKQIDDNFSQNPDQIHDYYDDYFEDKNQIQIDKNLDHSQLLTTSGDENKSNIKYKNFQFGLQNIKQEYHYNKKNNKKYLTSFVIHKKSTIRNTMIVEYEQEDLGYQPASIPSNINLAISHKKANKLGIPTNYQKVCNCCIKPVFKKKFKFWRSNPLLARYGSGLPVYFYVIIQNVIICILVFLINSIYVQLKEDLICQQFKDECFSYALGLKVLYPKFLEDKKQQLKETEKKEKKEKIRQKISQIERNMTRIKNFLKFTVEHSTFTGSIFVSFKYIQMAQQILSDSYVSKFQQLKIKLGLEKPNPQFFIYDKPVKIKKAPEPDDIIWENFGIPPGKKLVSRIIEFILHITFLAVCTATFMGLYEFQNYLKNTYPELNDIYNIYDLIMSFFFSSAIMMFIFAGKIVIFKLTMLRYYQTYSQRDSNLMTKYLFFNMSASFYQSQMKYQEHLFDNSYDRCKPVAKNFAKQKHIKRKARQEIAELFQNEQLIQQ